MYNLALIGTDIQHSLSPKIHQDLAKKYGISLRYDLIDIELQDFEDNFNFIKKKYDKINVTAPFKQVIKKKCTFLDNVSLYAILFNVIFLDI